MRPLILRLEAEADIEEAFRWYEKQSHGLGAEFLRAVDACLALIARQPELYPEKYKHARQALLRRFPYSIYYVIQPNTVDVLACFHERRNPRRWQSRV
jgi:plasmid stabilization system protein ParE